VVVGAKEKLVHAIAAGLCNDMQGLSMSLVQFASLNVIHRYSMKQLTPPSPLAPPQSSIEDDNLFIALVLNLLILVNWPCIVLVPQDQLVDRAMAANHPVIYAHEMLELLGAPALAHAASVPAVDI
jgi:hypothetical protein